MGELELAVEWLKAGSRQRDRNEVRFYRIDQNAGMDTVRSHPAYLQFVDDTFGHPSTCPG